ncbi:MULTISPECIES: glycosyltransferase family 2 protein [Natrialbaceae]|uniref:glycosyltransferase family 2 protein n=1 Tax=Natrialbaceae TaxID=1644061 RepID=UPI00207CB711|nr:glycosyltransferase family 2 protein [Natronococcus sp. CG52]
MNTAENAPRTASHVPSKPPLKMRSDETDSTPTRSESERPTVDAPSGGVLLASDSEIDPVLSIIMPTLNEEVGVVECLRRIKRAVTELDVPAEVIVSDSSTDRTPAIAREHGAIVVTPDGIGYGYAYRYAFERARGDYIAIGDADTTYDFEDLPRLYERVAHGDADMALGSRLNGEIEPGAMPLLHRYIGNPALTMFLNVFYDANVSDAHSGFRVVEKEALDQLELRSSGMEFASEMLMKANVEGLEIEEVPITYHTREGEAKLSTLHDGWRHVRFMLINAPGYLFSVPSVLFLVSGIALLLSARFTTDILVFFGLRAAVVGSLLLIVGFQIGSLAVFSTVAGGSIRATRDPLTNWIADSRKLEHGLTAGVLLSVSGTAYYAVLLVRALEAGSPPSLISSMTAFTVIILGLQTVFSSFFFSLLGDYHK